MNTRFIALVTAATTLLQHGAPDVEINGVTLSRFLDRIDVNQPPSDHMTELARVSILRSLIQISLATMLSGESEIEVSVNVA